MAGGNQSALHQSLVSTIRDYFQKGRKGWALKYFAGGLGGKPGCPDFLVAVPIPGADLAAFVAVEAKNRNR